MQTQTNTRADQARINGAKSRGATTPAGLEKCRLASVKHGAYVAVTSVIPGENPNKYAVLLDSLVDQYNPRNVAEYSIVCSLADAIWRQRRMSDAANYEIYNKMHFYFDDQASNKTSAHLDAEAMSTVVYRLEARARHFTREIARLQRILLSMQKYDVSDEASQKSKEVLDLAVEKLEQEAAEAAKAEPQAPPPPGKQPPKRENLSRRERKQLRQ